MQIQRNALSKCNAFRAKSIEERRQLLKETGVCFRCYGPKAQLKRDCKVDVKCSECGSQFHCSALQTSKRFVQSTQQHGEDDDKMRIVNIVNKCTDVCGSHIEGKSCAKTLPINVAHIDYPSTCLKASMVLDEQSNRMLVRSKLLDYFDIHSPPKEYTLSSCSEKSLMLGRRDNGFVIQSLDGKSEICLP